MNLSCGFVLILRNLKRVSRGKDDESNMETERKNVGTAVPGKETVEIFQNKGEEGPISIETIAEDESSSGKTVPTRVPVADRAVREPLPTLERVSVQNQRNESAHVPKDAPNVSRDEKEVVSHRLVAGVANLDKGAEKLCRCGKDHGPAIANMINSVFGLYERRGIPVSDHVKLSEAIAERDPIKMAEAMYGSLPSVWGKQTDVSNARATKDGDKEDPVSERFGLFGVLSPSGDTEKLDPVEEQEPAYPNVASYNAKYGFHKEGEGDGEKKDQSADTGGGEDRVGWCAICCKIHPHKSLSAALQPRFFVLRRETPEKKDDAKEEKTAAAATDKDEDDSLASRVAQVQQYFDVIGEKGPSDEANAMSDSIRSHIKDIQVREGLRFQLEQQRRINVATNDMKRAATCKGPELTFEILAMLTETKRYVKRDEDEPEYFPQWLYYALKKLIFIAKKIVMTKNKYECSRLARTIDEVSSVPPKEDKAAIKILKYAKGAVTIIAGEVALAFLEK